eukprot:Rhum_TRINITY_DN9366_c0_g1::Rhum_TRINITY_DN9366_c0_g1_i1::g.33088::m.33088
MPLAPNVWVTPARYPTLLGSERLTWVYCMLFACFVGVAAAAFESWAVSLATHSDDEWQRHCLRIDAASDEAAADPRRNLIVSTCGRLQHAALHNQNLAASAFNVMQAALCAFAVSAYLAYAPQAQQKPHAE